MERNSGEEEKIQVWEISDESEAEEEDSDEDFTFEEEVEDETLKKLTKLRISPIKKRESEFKSVPKEDIQDYDSITDSFERVSKIVRDGGIKTLTIEDCKAYLRRYSLRLSGKKADLQARIQEHLEISEGRGMYRYPVSSFCMNCKGDACTGDVVLFEQSGNVSRTVAGRIVKESYGAAKQQHTFTIEVLWSKGKKPLPALYPLLIKGRNLYKMKTMRQKWTDEGERQKVLNEKHQRGNTARSKRDIRIREKELRIQSRERRNKVRIQSREQRNKVRPVQSEHKENIPVQSQPSRQEAPRPPPHYQAKPVMYTPSTTHIAPDRSPLSDHGINHNRHGDIPRHPGHGAIPTQNGHGAIPTHNGHGGSIQAHNGHGGVLSRNDHGGISTHNGHGGIPSHKGHGGIPTQNSHGAIPSHNGHGGIPTHAGHGGISTHNGHGGVLAHNCHGGIPTHNGHGGIPTYDGHGGTRARNGHGVVPTHYGHGGAYQDAGNGMMNHRYRPLCLLYMQRRCRFGESCKFRHPGSERDNGAARSYR